MTDTIAPLRQLHKCPSCPHTWEVLAACIECHAAYERRRSNQVYCGRGCSEAARQRAYVTKRRLGRQETKTRRDEVADSTQSERDRLDEELAELIRRHREGE